MTRRPAVTLMEVLIAMFIMAIGMMALMALFPVGAVSMAQALKDDRCAYASAMAENVAIVNNVRYGDVNVALALANLNPALGVPNSGLAFVDPFGVVMMPANPPFGTALGVSTLSTGIPRVSPSFILPAPPALPQSIDRWFSLPDDIGFNLSGIPDTSNTGGLLDRGRRYSYAYLLRQQPPPWSPFQISMKAIQLYAIVYSGRPINSPIPETTLLATGYGGTNSISIAAVGTTLKRGGWILDTSYNAALGQINGNFYRVTNIAEFGGTTTIEVQQTIPQLTTITQITIMDHVVEVFDKGYGYQQ